MRRALVLALLVAAAVPATASAKELTGFTLCGPDGCRETDLTSFGHEDPFAGDAEPAPPGAYLAAALEVDGDSSWRMFYVPREGLLGFADGEARTVRWLRPDPRLATALKRTARGLHAYPGPRLRAVTVGDRRIEDGASSYLGLLDLRGPYADPGSWSGERIRFEAVVPSPWTEEDSTTSPRRTSSRAPVAGSGSRRRWPRTSRPAGRSTLRRAPGRGPSSSPSRPRSCWPRSCSCCAAARNATRLPHLRHRRRLARSHTTKGEP